MTAGQSSLWPFVRQWSQPYHEFYTMIAEFGVPAVNMIGAPSDLSIANQRLSDLIHRW